MAETEDSADDVDEVCGSVGSSNNTDSDHKMPLCKAPDIWPRVNVVYRRLVQFGTAGYEVRIIP